MIEIAYKKNKLKKGNFMKNKTILSLICLVLAIGLMTGCNKNVPILQTESDVYSYLEEHFPNETFKIISVEKSNKHIDGGCDSKEKLNIWTVYSETTQTTFEVYETNNFNSFICYYSVDDNYQQIKKA